VDRLAPRRSLCRTRASFSFKQNLEWDSLNNFDEISRAFCWRKLAETRAARAGDVEHMSVAGPVVGIVGYSYYR
jgi:hypothetical protein